MFIFIFVLNTIIEKNKKILINYFLWFLHKFVLLILKIIFFKICYLPIYVYLSYLVYLYT